jgi:hypothetical protein
MGARCGARDVLAPIGLRLRLDGERESHLARSDRDVIDIPAGV